MSVELSESITLYLREEWGARRARPGTAEQGWNAREAFIHHTADSYRGLDSFEEQCARMRAYQDLHMNLSDPRHGWNDIGYHFVVFPPFQHRGEEIPARVFQGRDRNLVPAAQLGHNEGTLAVCVVGNYESDFLHRNTIFALEVLLTRYDKLRYLGGHRDVVSTSCPGDRLYSELSRIAKVAGLKRYHA